MQDFRARSAPNGAESTILENFSDFFRKITEVSEIFPKFSKNLPNFRIFRRGGGGYDANFGHGNISRDTLIVVYI